MNKSPQGRPWRVLSSLLQLHQGKQLCRHPWKSKFPQLQCIYHEPWQDHRKSSIKPPGGNLRQAHLRGGRGLFNLETTMVSVLHKELEYKVEKLKYNKFSVMKPTIRVKFESPLGK